MARCGVGLPCGWPLGASVCSGKHSGCVNEVPMAAWRACVVCLCAPVCTCACVREGGREEEMGCEVCAQQPGRQCGQTPALFASGLCVPAYTGTPGHRHRDMQSQEVSLAAQTARTQLLAVPHAETQPLGVRPLHWMVVMIFGHLARDRVTMATTKQQSSQQPSA